MNNGNFFPGNNFSGMSMDDKTVLDNQSLPNYNQIQNNWFNNNEMEQLLYIEDILKLNKGKKAKLYVTIPGSKDNQDKVFEGIIEQIGKDHIIVSNPTTGEWSLILLPYLTFISFDETINYK